MVMVNNEALLGTGFRSRIFSVGASVALEVMLVVILRLKRIDLTYKARAANVSMIRLTHSSCTALRTLWLFSL